MSTAVSRTLARARAAWRGSEVLGALARWLAPVLGALLLLLLLDNLLHLGGVLRLVLGLLWVLGTLAFFGLVVVPRSLRRRSLEATARLVEERLGVGGNVLINALQLARDARAGGAPVPEAALAEVAARAEKAAGLVDVARLWRFGPLVKAVRVAGAALLAVLAYALLFPDHAANAVHRYRDPLGEVMPLTNVRLDVSPGDAEAVAGTTVEVRVRVGVRQGDLPSAALLLVRGAGEPWETRTLSLSRTSPGEREFAAGLGPLAADLEYQVRCGDARSPVWRVRVIQPTARHWDVFARVLTDGQATANLVTDAHLAALAIEHGCELHSTDGDFARFPTLRWKNPLSPARSGARTSIMPDHRPAARQTPQTRRPRFARCAQPPRR